MTATATRGGEPHGPSHRGSAPLRGDAELWRCGVGGAAAAGTRPWWMGRRGRLGVGRGQRRDGRRPRHGARPRCPSAGRRRLETLITTREGRHTSVQPVAAQVPFDHDVMLFLFRHGRGGDGCLHRGGKGPDRCGRGPRPAASAELGAPGYPLQEMTGEAGLGRPRARSRLSRTSMNLRSAAALLETAPMLWTGAREVLVLVLEGPAVMTSPGDLRSAARRRADCPRAFRRAPGGPWWSHPCPKAGVSARPLRWESALRRLAARRRPNAPPGPCGQWRWIIERSPAWRRAGRPDPRRSCPWAR